MNNSNIFAFLSKNWQIFLISFFLLVSLGYNSKLHREKNELLYETLDLEEEIDELESEITSLKNEIDELENE